MVTLSVRYVVVSFLYTTRDIRSTYTILNSMACLFNFDTIRKMYE